MQANSRLDRATNMAQVYFHGTCDNKFLVIGFKGADPIGEFVVPVRGSARKILKDIGRMLSQSGAESVALVTRTTWHAEGEQGPGLWVLIKDEFDRCQARVYSLNIGVCDSYLNIVGLMQEDHYTCDAVPSLIEFLIPEDEKIENGVFDRCLSASNWTLDKALQQRVSSTLN